MIGQKNKQKALEVALQIAYADTSRAHVIYNRFCWIKIFNERNLKRIVKTVEKQNEIFRELREVTRENYPERFI